MSVILQQSQARFQRCLRLEIGLLALVLAVIFVARNAWFISALWGMLTGFLPQCVFVWGLFRKKQTQQRHKVNQLYCAEALKMAGVIVLFTLVLALGWADKPLVYFAGFMLALGLNAVLPVYLTLRDARRQKCD